MKVKSYIYHIIRLGFSGCQSAMSDTDDHSRHFLSDKYRKTFQFAYFIGSINVLLIFITAEW